MSSSQSLMFDPRHERPSRSSVLQIFGIESVYAFLQPYIPCISSPGESPNAVMAPVVIPIGVCDAKVAESISSLNQGSATCRWHGFLLVGFVPMVSASLVAWHPTGGISGIQVDDVISTGHVSLFHVLSQGKGVRRLPLPARQGIDAVPWPVRVGLRLRGR